MWMICTRGRVRPRKQWCRSMATFLLADVRAVISTDTITSMSMSKSSNVSSRDAQSAEHSCARGVVWFGGQLPWRELQRVENFLDRGACDIVIVAGTTATFGYIIDWALRAGRDRGQLIEVNPEETPLSRFAKRLVREPAAIALPRIVDQIIR